MRLATVCLLFILGQSSYAAMPGQFRAGRLSADLATTYYKTKANYDYAGDKVDIIGDRSYTHIGFLFESTYVFPQQYSITGLGQIAHATSVGYFEDRTNSELNEIGVIGRKLFNWSYLRLIPEFGYSKALNTLSDNQDDLFTSDAADRMHLGAWAMIHQPRFRIYAYTGYVHRSEDLSSLLDWKLGGLARGKTFGGKFELSGYTSLSDDKYTDTPAQRLFVNEQVNGGSHRFNALNPSIVELKLEGHYYFLKTWSTGLGFTMPLGGENTAAGNTILANLSWFTDLSKPQKSSSAKRIKGRRKAVGSDNSQSIENEFEPVLEDYDEKLFESDQE